MKEINLNFEDYETVIAGNKYGHAIYLEQVEKYIDFDSQEDYVIVFPPHVLAVIDSIARGFFKEAIANDKLEFFKEHVNIVGNGKIRQTFEDVLNEFIGNN